MAASQPARHGSEAGYREEIKRGEPCEKCRNGHRQFDKQYTKKGKQAGLRYGRYEVLDHLYRPGVPRGVPVRARGLTESSVPRASRIEADAPRPSVESDSELGEFTVTSEPSLADRMSDRIREFILPDGGSDFVPVDEMPEYLTGGNDSMYDAPPADDQGWSEIPAEEFVINAAGMKKIEDTLGMYLSVVGMTVEMIDPYCGPILADNFQNIVERWSKIIAHYPKSAALFLNEKGGVLMLWMGGIQATWPVLYAMYKHHLAGTVKVTADGRIMEMHAPGTHANEHAGMFDNLTPTTDQFNYSA
jgi:hypothetical protein